MLLLLSLIIAPERVAAENSGEFEFGTIVEGSITENVDNVLYSFVLTQAGRVSLIFTSRIQSVQLRWTDENMQDIKINEWIEPGSETSPKVFEEYIDLEAGTYCIRIQKRGSYVGDFELMLTFAAANNNETEPNNTPERAQPLDFSSAVRGFISHQDSDDYYKFTLTEAGRVSLRLTSRIYTVQLRWIDSLLREIRGHAFIEYGSEAGPRVHEEWMDLEAGTYFIRVHKSGSHTGVYDLVLAFSPSRNNEIEPNNSPEAAQQLTAGQVVRGLISDSDSDDYFSIVLDYPMRLSLKLTSRIYSVQLRWLGSNLQDIRVHSWIEIGSEGSPRILEDYMDLEAGTYYIRVHRRENHTGTYDLVLYTGTSHAPQIQNNVSDWAVPEILKAIDMNLIPTALADSSVDYTRPITRAEFAGIAVKVYENIANTTVQPALSNPFIDTRDVDALRAYNAGLMVGISPSEFAPNTLLNRETAATALTRSYKRAIFPGWSLVSDAYFPLTFVQPPKFDDDADISNWAKESVYFMAAHEIIEGVGENIFAPRALTADQQGRDYAIATREQALAIAVRMVEQLVP